MAKFKIGSSTRPNFSRTGLHYFQDLKAGEMLTSWSHSAISDTIFRLFLFFWIIPLIAIFIYATINFSGLPDQIPLFYSRTWGENQLAMKSYIFLPAAGALLLGIFNFSLAVGFHIHDKVSSYLLAGTAAITALLASITTFNIIRLII